MKILRASLVSALVATALIGVSGISTASTSTVAPGTTLTATAWETDHDGFSYDSNSVTIVPDGTYDEYVYRLFDGTVSVDAQSTDGYDGLTDAEQTQWYIAAGLAPYEFSWHAFFCLADSVTDPSVGVQTDAGVVLNEVKYHSAAQLFPTTDRQITRDYQPLLYNKWNDGSLFEVEAYSVEQRSTVGYVSNEYNDLVFGTSYVDATCPTDATLVVAEINEPGSNSLAVDRELTVPQTLTVEDSVLGEFEVDSSGVILGVTGAVGYNVDFNAALWGVTQVSDSELSNTGLDLNLGALGAVAAGAVIAGVGILRRRRR
jgi:hypothetical protein